MRLSHVCLINFLYCQINHVDFAQINDEILLDCIDLIAGGSGFLGQHIVRECQLHDPRSCEIRILDLAPYENRLGKFILI